MAPERKCAEGKLLVELDIRVGEHLLHEVSFNGALGKFIIKE
jgi:hypothetical protein